MKNLLIALAVCGSTLSAAAQGTILFANYVNGILLAPIYGKSPADQTVQTRGQGALGIPGGATAYSGSLLNGSGYSVALYAGPKNTPAESLQLVATSTFRPSGVDDLPAGLWLSSVVAVPGVSPGQRVSVELRVWDNKGGTINTWEDVIKDGYADRGTSGVFSPLGILGEPVGTAMGPANDNPLILVGLTSFNLTVGPLAVPEPATGGVVALGLGVLYLVRVVRRRLLT
jgi:hypothetical protein